VADILLGQSSWVSTKHISQTIMTIIKAAPLSQLDEAPAPQQATDACVYTRNGATAIDHTLKLRELLAWKLKARQPDRSNSPTKGYLQITFETADTGSLLVGGENDENNEDDESVVFRDPSSVDDHWSSSSSSSSEEEDEDEDEDEDDDDEAVNDDLLDKMSFSWDVGNDDDSLSSLSSCGRDDSDSSWSSNDDVLPLDKDDNKILPAQRDDYFVMLGQRQPSMPSLKSL
jgi:hypothetical protein